MEKEIIIGVLQMSDRASVDTNAYSSLSGDAIIAVLTSYIKSPFRTIFNIIPDEYDLIIQSFHTLAVTEKCCLILTTGGTGPAKRDVTVEATEAFCQKINREELLPGDLIFFGDKRVNHVALYLGNNQYIHSSGKETGNNGIAINLLTDDRDNVSRYYYQKLWSFGRVMHN